MLIGAAVLIVRWPPFRYAEDFAPVSLVDLLLLGGAVLMAAAVLVFVRRR